MIMLHAGWLGNTYISNNHHIPLRIRTTATNINNTYIFFFLFFRIEKRKRACWTCFLIWWGWNMLMTVFYYGNKNNCFRIILITFCSFRMSYFLILLFFKKCYRLSQFFMIFCIFMNIYSFFICLASLN